METRAETEIDVIDHEGHRGNIWRSSTERPAMRLEATFHPVPKMKYRGALVSMDFTGSGGIAVAVLTTADAQALAQRLLDMADTAESL